MKYYFQYLHGENQGKVVTLVGKVDDIGELNVPIVTYKFSDGNRCNVDLIAEINDTDAFNSNNAYMIRVYNDKNIWRFKKFEMHNADRKMLTVDGREVTGFNPYKKDQSLDESTRVKMVAFPPNLVVYKGDKKGIEEMKQKAANGGFIDQSGIFQLQTANNEISYQKFKVLGRGNDIQGLRSTDDFLDRNSAAAPSREDLEKNGHVAVGLLIVNYPIRKNKEIFDKNGNIVEEDAAAKAALERQLSAQKPIPDTNRPIPDMRNIPPTPAPVPQPKVITKMPEPTPEELPIQNTRENDDVQTVRMYKVDAASPVIGIIKKCKKQEIDVPLTLNLNIPGKSVFKFISDNFDEDAENDFFNIIIDQIPLEAIRDSLRDALVESYTAKKDESSTDEAE